MYESLKFLSGGKFTSSGAWIHSERIIDNYEFIIVTAGEVKMFVGDEEYCVLPGEVLLIRPGVKHGGTAESRDTSFFWLHFNLCEDIGIGTFSRPVNAERLFLVTKELMHYAGAEGYPPECADCLARVILHEIEHKKREEHPTVAEVTEWIRKNRTRQITCAECAAHFGYNADYLNRLFKKHVGKGLKDCINDTKMTFIKSDVMMGGVSLSEIADKYGFPDYKYFTKYFKYHEKMTPAEYRKTCYKMHTN